MLSFSYKVGSPNIIPTISSSPKKKSSESLGNVPDPTINKDGELCFEDIGLTGASIDDTAELPPSLVPTTEANSLIGGELTVNSFINSQDDSVADAVEHLNEKKSSN